MKTIVKEDLVSGEVALRLYDKGIHILSDHTICKPKPKII